MKPVVIAGITALSMAMFCIVTPNAAADEPVTVKVLGIVAEKPEGGYQFIDLTEDEVMGWSHLVDVPLDKTVWSQYVMKLQIDHGTDKHSKILFGPNPGTTELAAIKVTHSSPTVFVTFTSGFVYAKGNTLTLKTDRVEAAADGSELIAQIETVENQHRAYFLHGTKAWATIVGTSNKPETSTENQFLAVTEQKTTEGWKNILEGTSEDTFRDEVLEMAEAAGITSSS